MVIFLPKGLDFHHQLASLLQKSIFNFKIHAIFLYSTVKTFSLFRMSFWIFKDFCQAAD